MSGISENSGILDPCELRKGDIFYLLLDHCAGHPAVIDKRKVLDIHCWVDHVEAPDYLGGDYDDHCCSLTYCPVDSPEDIRKVPRVPSTWKMFRTEEAAKEYAVKQLTAAQEVLTEEIKRLEELKKGFQSPLE